MKKFVGLLLNCAAVCLCSAIGIGMGMYWMRTTQQTPIDAPVPAIQQVSSTSTGQVYSAPNLIRVPATPAPQASPIPTSVAPQTNMVQQVAAINNQPPLSPSDTSVSLLVENKTIGTIHKDTTGVTGPIFYLTPDELKTISLRFTKGSGASATDIINPTVTGIQGAKKYVASTANPVTATYSIPPQTFVNGSLTIVASLPTTTTNTTATVDFTFQIENYPVISSVKIKSPKNSSTEISISEGGEYYLPGPSANLSILISGKQVDSKLEIFRKTGTTEKSLLAVDKKVADFSTPVTYEIMQTGEYIVKLYEENKPEPYETFEFQINNAIQDQPKYPEIGAVTDSGNGSGSLKIKYATPNASVNGIPCYVLRGSSLEIEISKEKDRTAVFEYQKLDSIPASQDAFKNFGESSSTTIPLDVETFVKKDLEAGIYQFRFKDSWVTEAGKGQSKTITVIVPKPSGFNPLIPAIASYKNQKYSEPNTNFSSPISLYNGYLELAGTNASPDRSLKFLLFNQSSDLLSPASPQQLTVDYEPGQKGAWKANLKVANTQTENPTTLYILRQEGDQFAFSRPVTIQLQSLTLQDDFQVQLNAIQVKNSDGNLVSFPTERLLNLNTDTPDIVTTDSKVTNTQILLYSTTSNTPLGYGEFVTQKSVKLLKTLSNGKHQLYFRAAQGDFIASKRSDTFTLNLQKGGFEVVDVQPPNFGTAPGVEKLKIKFSPKNPLATENKSFTNADLKDIYHLVPSKGTGNFLSGTEVTIKDGAYQAYDNSMILTVENIPADIYQLVITGSELKDIFGNMLEGNNGEAGTNFVRVLNKPGSDSASASRTAVPAVPTTDFVEYHEYEKRDVPEDGFNPSDKVVTRVARLYYYRDAHRVAQILNSEVQSLNHKGYQDAQLQADQARESYEAAVLNRRLQEEKSIRASKALRQKENEYRNQQQILSGLVRERANPNIDDATKQQLESAITDAQGVMNDLRGDISSLSTEMNTQDDELKKLSLKEDQLSAALFRSELRAEKTDLYTIGNGDPESYDAVRQVTIKVIGEGLIHLRGPIKGVNIIRTMINQIDAPVGQVRIAMHTIQVNGEDAKRMENVADRIQKSIDQSRFLTVQSAQMLRKAIVAVASEVAISTCQDGFAMTQEQRDEKYLYSFFGRDFIQALEDMDSEFLQSGNKLLSIHSMDTTSLSSALFVLALAKNDIRQQILARFYASIEGDLPEAECQFLYQGGITKANKHPHKMNLLAPYANFQSFRGFFDHEVIGTDTMTPIQREFVRLAQIFKARLITERELNLHVMERAMIEQRVGDYMEELKAAKAKEDLEEQALESVQKSVQNSQIKVIQATTNLQNRISEITTGYNRISNDFNSFEIMFNGVVNSILRAVAGRERDDKTIDITNLSNNDRKKLLDLLFPIDEKKSDKRKFLTNAARIKKALDMYFSEELTALGIRNIESQPLWDNGKLENYKRTFRYGDHLFELSIRREGNTDEFKYTLKDPSEFLKLDAITKKYVENAEKAISMLEWYHQTDLMQAKLNRAKFYLHEITSFDRDSFRDLNRVASAYKLIQEVSSATAEIARSVLEEIREVNVLLGKAGTTADTLQAAYAKWNQVSDRVISYLKAGNPHYEEATELFQQVDKSFNILVEAGLKLKFAEQNAKNSRLSLDHKKFLDMQVDQTEDKFIELVEGTRAHTANIDNYLKRIATALEDDFNTQFYYPAFKEARDASRYWNVSFGSMETSSILTNNRSLGKVAPKATIEFDLPKRQLAIIEGMNIAEASFKEYGALVNDPTFLAITSMNGGENVQGGYTIQPDSLDKQVLGQPGLQGQRFGSAFENLIPDPAVFKFETGTGFTVRPVIQPDGQAVVFDLNYLYRTNVREPVRADEKHLGRIKEHFIDTDVQLGNYELREISRFVIALKATRTANGVPLLSDVPGVGVLFRPTPSAESSLQQSQIMSQAVIYPTLFDLMGLRWAPAVADVGPLELSNREFISKGRDRFLQNRVYDYAGSQVDQFLQIQEPERRSDLYRSQETIPDVHPNGYMGPGLNLKRSHLQENYHPEQQNPTERFVPRSNSNSFEDRDRAVPVIPSAPGLPSLPPIPSNTQPETSAIPMQDHSIQPISWTTTSSATKQDEVTFENSQTEFQISSPRRVSRKPEAPTQPGFARPGGMTPRKPMQPVIPAAPAKQPSIYKRSVSRLKSLFKN